MAQVILMAESAPLFYAMQEAGHEPDDMGVEDWVIDEDEPVCDHCAGAGTILDGGSERDCPRCQP